MKRLFPLLLLTGSLIAFQAAAHEGETHESATQQSAPLALQQVQRSFAVLDALISARKMSDVHEEIERAETALGGIRAAAHAPAEDAVRLEAAVKQLKKQLEKVHAASDANSPEAVAAEMKKAHAGLKLVESNLN